MDTLHTKYDALRGRLQELGSLAVAFSGGVDSTFLLQVAHDVLGDRALAVTAAPPFVPGREQKEASDFLPRSRHPADRHSGGSAGS